MEGARLKRPPSQPILDVMHEKKKKWRDGAKQRGEDFSLPQQNRHSGNGNNEDKDPQYQEKAALAMLTPISPLALNEKIGVEVDRRYDSRRKRRSILNSLRRTEKTRRCVGVLGRHHLPPRASRMARSRFARPIPSRRPRSAQSTFVKPGMATGYRPCASGLTGGSQSMVNFSMPGANSRFEFSACSQVISWPDSAAMRPRIPTRAA